jgi:hypothetical protein
VQKSRIDAVLLAAIHRAAECQQTPVRESGEERSSKRRSRWPDRRHRGGAAADAASVRRLALVERCEFRGARLAE